MPKGRSCSHSLGRGHQGFTLVELLMSLVVLSILLAIGIPSFKSIIADQRVRAATTDLQSALILARVEAIKRGVVVTLRPASGQEWAQGWLIQNPATGNDSNPLAKYSLGDGVNIDSAASQVAFRPSGRLSAGSVVTFEVTSSQDSEKVRCVSLGIDGRATSAKGGC
ncbi:GspH/FimT family pseudopilin [Pseudomonas sp. NY15181]|uniref:GspH/FimT family pseudopilin n=1 Tax=Pseudomonas sp. NY15181 TaxID=3400349 RepID=UPI003A83E250